MSTSNISKIILFNKQATHEMIDRYFDTSNKNLERHYLSFAQNFDMTVTWLNTNKHLYSSVKGIPIWFSIYLILNKIKVPTAMTLVTETKGKIDSIDYALEIKNSIKPEYFTIISSGLSEVVGIKDE